MGKRIILHKKLWHLSILHSLQEQLFERVWGVLWW